MIYMYFDIRFQMVVIFSIYLEQIWFLIYLFQRYKKGRNPLIPRGLRPFLRKLEIGLEPTTPSLRVFGHSLANSVFVNYIFLPGIDSVCLLSLTLLF